MAILTLGELEPYKCLRLDTEMIRGVPQRTLRELQAMEQQLSEQSGYGVPYLVAVRLYVDRKSTSQTAKEFGVRDPYCLPRILKHCGIPRLSNTETSGLSYTKKSDGNIADVYSGGDNEYPSYTLPIGSMLSKACQRCDGDLIVNSDKYGFYWDCAQCGHIIDIPMRHSEKVAVS